MSKNNRGIGFFILLIVIVVIAYQLQQQPVDLLVINDLHFDKTPPLYRGDSHTLKVNVGNNADFNVSSIYVELDNYSPNVQPLVVSQVIPFLESKNNTTVSFNFFIDVFSKKENVTFDVAVYAPNIPIKQHYTISAEVR